MTRGLAIAARALLILLAVGTITLMAALVLSVEAEPRVPALVDPTPEEIERLKQTLERYDPRRLEPGELAALSLNERELSLGLSRALEMVEAGEVAWVEIGAERLRLRTSLELPVGFERRFVNLDLVMRETDSLPRVERLRFGRTPVPAWLADSAWRRIADRWLARQGVPGALEMVRTVSFEDRTLDVTYRWQPSTVESLRARLVGPEETGRIELYHRKLVALTEQHVRNAKVPLGTLLAPLFDLARRRSSTSDPRVENRAVILALGGYLGPRPIDRWLPEAEEWPRPRQLSVTLRGQWDLSTHFVTSATVSALGGRALADAVGLYKELSDRGGGSGFSFQDLAADRAGTRFGELAVRSRDSAAAVQKRLGDDAGDSALLPQVEDLPDALSDDEFRHRYGEVGGPEYRALQGEIDRRIEALPLYRGR